MGVTKPIRETNSPQSLGVRETIKSTLSSKHSNRVIRKVNKTRMIIRDEIKSLLRSQTRRRALTFHNVVVGMELKCCMGEMKRLATRIKEHYTTKIQPQGHA